MFLVLAVVVGAIMLLFAAFYLVGGYKMLKEQRSGRVFGMIGSILSLFSFPLGTALGIYGLWFLLGDLGRGLYDGIAGQGMRYSPPPPPNSWQ
jgi:asparagine N-glycosylation enzyme membrane subunit Stt3